MRYGRSRTPHSPRADFVGDHQGRISDFDHCDRQRELAISGWRSEELSNGGAEAKRAMIVPRTLRARALGPSPPRCVMRPSAADGSPEPAG